MVRDARIFALYYYGDAEAHLDIARRIIDSRTPGPEQIGTVWLPLPHLVLIPFVMRDAWWYSGLAGVIPSVACFVLAGLFLFSAARRAYASWQAALVVALLFALNPNILYLQATPMTEPLFLASLAALLWATLWFRDSQSLWAVLIAAVASNAASLTRYEGWFLIPFVCLYFLMTAKNKWHAIVFGALAALGPLSWLAHNQYLLQQRPRLLQRTVFRGRDLQTSDRRTRRISLPRRSRLENRTALLLCSLALDRWMAIIDTGGRGNPGRHSGRAGWAVLLLLLHQRFTSGACTPRGRPFMFPISRRRACITPVTPLSWATLTAFCLEAPFTFVPGLTGA